MKRFLALAVVLTVSSPCLAGTQPPYVVDDPATMGNMIDLYNLMDTHAHTGADSVSVNGVPSGSLIMFGGATAPSGWLLCDGSAVSRTTYAALFTAIGTTYGAGDSATTFNLPDMRGVFPKGSGTTTRAAGVDANGTAYAATLGAYTQDKLQGHYHTVRGPSGGADGSRKASASGGGVTSYAEGGDNTNFLTAQGLTTNGANGTPRVGHTTEPQSVGVSFIIKF